MYWGSDIIHIYRVSGNTPDKLWLHTCRTRAGYIFQCIIGFRSAALRQTRDESLPTSITYWIRLNLVVVSRHQRHGGQAQRRTYQQLQHRVDDVTGLLLSRCSFLWLSAAILVLRSWIYLGPKSCTIFCVLLYILHSLFYDFDILYPDLRCDIQLLQTIQFVAKVKQKKTIKLIKR